MRSVVERTGLGMASVLLKKGIFHPMGREHFKGRSSGEMSWGLFVGEQGPKGGGFACAEGCPED